MNSTYLDDLFYTYIDKSSLLYNYYYVKELFFLCIILYLLSKHIIFIIFICFLFYFYRSSPSIEKHKNYFISPSNSKIEKISKEDKNTIIKTYLSPLDKHYMIAPCKSKVIKITRKVNAEYADNLSITFETYIKNKRYTYTLEQIVHHIGNWGYIPSVIYKHRCIAFVKEGDYVEQGEKYGLIRFGSCMKYIIPNDMIKCRKYMRENKYLNIGDKLFRIHNH